MPQLAFVANWEMSPIPITPRLNEKLGFVMPLGVLIRNINEPEMIPEFVALKVAANAATEASGTAVSQSSAAVQISNTANDGSQYAVTKVDALDAQIEGITTGLKPFYTYADLLTYSGSDKGSFIAQVTNDPDPAKIKNYTWDETTSSWVESYDRISDLGIQVNKEAAVDTDADTLVFSIVDETEKVVFAITEDEGVKTPGVDFRKTKDTGYAISFTDQDGRIAFGIGDDGEFKSPAIDQKFEETQQEFSEAVQAETTAREGAINALGIATNETAVADTDGDVLPFAVVDEQDNVLLGIADNLDVKIGDVKLNKTKDTGYPLMFVDGEDNPIWIVPVDDGYVPPVAVEVPQLQKTDWMHGGTYGQSVALGAGTNTTLSTSQPYQNITFQSGVLLDDAVLDFSSTKPLVEDSTAGGIPLESPTSSFLNGVTSQGIASSDTAGNWVMFGHSGGKGGTDLINLSKGTVPYAQHISAYQGAYNLAQAQGKSYSVWFIAFIQGEGDISYRRTMNHFYKMLLQLKDDFDADIKAITKQPFSPLMITYQTASHRYYPIDTINVANAQLKASVDRADIVMACPMYQFDYADNIHLKANSSVQLGKYLSKAAYKMWRHIEYGEPEFKPLQPEKIIWQDKIIDVTFHVPDGSLQFNTSIVAAATNMGFDIRVNNVVQSSAIVSVTIVGKNRVRIVLDNVYQNGTLTYGQGRTGDPSTSGSTTGPRGNLCDHAGDTDFYTDTLGVTRYMHNWCVIFSYHSVRGFFQ